MAARVMKSRVTPEYSNIHRVVTQTNVLNNYREMVRDIKKIPAWLYDPTIGRIRVLDTRGMVRHINELSRLKKNGVIKCEEFNKSVLEVDGKNWYVLTIQAVDKKGELLDQDMDSYAMMLGGFMVSGFVVWYETEGLRDMAFDTINGTTNLVVEIEPTFKHNEFTTTKLTDEEQAEREQERLKKENQLIAMEKEERKQRRQQQQQQPKKEECPLSPAELKAIPPRPPAKLRSPAGSLIDNTKKQQQWDAKYSIYRKWLK